MWMRQSTQVPVTAVPRLFMANFGLVGLSVPGHPQPPPILNCPDSMAISSGGEPTPSFFHCANTCHWPVVGTSLPSRAENENHRSSPGLNDAMSGTFSERLPPPGIVYAPPELPDRATELITGANGTASHGVDLNPAKPDSKSAFQIWSPPSGPATSRPVASTLAFPATAGGAETPAAGCGTTPDVRKINVPSRAMRVLARPTWLITRQQARDVRSGLRTDVKIRSKLGPDAGHDEAPQDLFTPNTDGIAMPVIAPPEVRNQDAARCGAPRGSHPPLTSDGFGVRVC